jgi:2-methylcitrate dehydratase
MATLAEELSDYALSINFGDLGDDVVLEAKKRVIDSLGCAIGAFREPPVLAARRTVVNDHPGRASTILGTRVKTSPDMATFVNGAMVRYFDYNDTYLSKEPAHPSDNISACLATAEREGSTGKDLLTAIALAYEVQCRLCDAADIRHRGWDHVCYGLVSSALASGRLLGLPRGKLTHAVNISLNSHIAMRQVRAGELSAWKGCSFANAARNAVFSAMLAGNGMTGPAPIFEGEMGFFKQISGPFWLDVSGFGGRGGTFKLVETYVKYFPAEYHAQSAIWAALAARRKVGGVEDIESVEVYTHEAGYTILGKDAGKWTPSTKETADHSLPYMVGMALLKGKVDNSTYSQKNIQDGKTLEFLKRITVREDEEFTRAYPRHIANRVTIRTKGGGTVTEQMDVPKGHPGNPMTKEEVESKFRRLTGRFLSEARQEKVLEFVWNLEKEREIDPLLRLCVVA